MLPQKANAVQEAGQCRVLEDDSELHSAQRRKDGGSRKERKQGQRCRVKESCNAGKELVVVFQRPCGLHF